MSRQQMAAKDWAIARAYGKESVTPPTAHELLVQQLKEAYYSDDNYKR